MRILWAAAGVVLLGGALSLRAQDSAPAPEDIAAGQRIYRQKADCQSCHGWAADGRKMDSQMPDGANLRTTKLDRAKLIVAIKCGVPGKMMPAFDKFAYTDGRCYNLKQADLQRMNATLPDARRPRCRTARSNRWPTSCSPRWWGRARWIGPGASSSGAPTFPPVLISRSSSKARFVEARGSRLKAKRLA